jgi:hypothetical protein
MPAIVYEVRGEVYVGALFFGVMHLDEFRRITHEWPFFRFGQKPTKMDFGVRQGLEGAEIDLLTPWRVWIPRTRADTCAEVSDF